MTATHICTVFTMSQNSDLDDRKVRIITTPETKRLVFARHDNIPCKRDDSESDFQDAHQVLDPNHPLLAKFQQALKQHLEKQIDHLRNEIFELETGGKKKKADREQLGVETYEAQQLVNKQQEELEMYVMELDNVCSATEQMEFELDEAKQLYTEKRRTLLEAETEERKLHTELESLNLLAFQMKEWENDIESELAVNQRVFEKTKRDKIHLANEKRQQDIIIYKLMTEIWKLEEELETIGMQLRVKEEERENLAEMIASRNIEVDAINSEHRILLHSWNSTIVAIGQRDKGYAAIKKESDDLYEKLRLMNIETEQTRKLCDKEMLRNERLTDIKNRVEMDLDNSKRSLTNETKKRDLLEMQIDKHQAILDQIESDLQKISAENANKTSELNCLMRDLEKVSQQKVALDEQILLSLEQQLTNNKAAKYLNKLVHQVKEKNRNLEINLANLENTAAKVQMDIEAQKCLNEETQQYLEEILKQLQSAEGEYKEQSSELERLRFTANKKTGEIEMLNRKIEVTSNKQGVGTEGSPNDVTILTLKKNITDVKDRIEKQQRFWLRQQGHVLSLSQQRQNQINDIDLLKKKMYLLIQKNLKITDELETYKKQQEKLDRHIINLQNRLVVLNDELNKKRGNKDSLGKDNDLMQSEYMAKLQDAELEILKIESDITDIEEDKTNLSNELIELNREALAWEKKIQMAVETKKNIDEERGEGGEVGNMKAEIHRMQVRYSQLKKAQDKLIHELEHCVSRRDAIITLAEAREKREKGAVDKTRINFLRKLEDMKSKVTQIQNEIDSIDKKMETTENEEKHLNTEITAIQNDTDDIRKQIQELFEQVQQAKTDRQRNLELLVLKQKKLKVYSELSKGRHPYIPYKTDSIINMEIEKGKELNGKLMRITENLLSDFPNHYQTLTRIMNTLKLSIFYF